MHGLSTGEGRKLMLVRVSLFDQTRHAPPVRSRFNSGAC